MFDCTNFVGTIAPARGIPGDGSNSGGSSDNNDGGMNDFETSVKYFLTNVNLIVPVVAAVAVIVIAIAVICVLRGRAAPPPGFPKGTIKFTTLPLSYFRTYWRITVGTKQFCWGWIKYRRE